MFLATMPVLTVPFARISKVSCAPDRDLDPSNIRHERKQPSHTIALTRALLPISKRRQPGLLGHLIETAEKPLVKHTLSTDHLFLLQGMLSHKPSGTSVFGSPHSTEQFPGRRVCCRPLLAQTFMSALPLASTLN